MHKLAISISSTTPTWNIKYHYICSTTIIRARKDEIDVSKLTIDSNDYKLNYKGSGLNDYPYLVFEIEVSERKPDWWTIPEIEKAYHQLINAIRSRKFQEISDQFINFRLAVILSPDLLDKDKDKIIEEIKNRYIVPFNNAIGVSLNDNDLEVLPLNQINIYS